MPVCSLDDVAKATADASDSLSFPSLSAWPILFFVCPFPVFGRPPRSRTRSWADAHDRQSSINRIASVSRSGATTFGCGNPDTGNGAFPGRVIRPAEKPTLWAPIVSHT